MHLLADCESSERVLFFLHKCDRNFPFPFSLFPFPFSRRRVLPAEVPHRARAKQPCNEKGLSICCLNTLISHHHGFYL